MSELAPDPPARRRFPPLLVAALAVVLLAVAVITAVWALRPRLTEEEVRATVVTTLAEEAPASFFVTGTLTFATTVEGRSDKTLLPGLLDLDLGTTRAEVRVPGRVAYGFDVRRLRPSDIRFTEEGVVEVAVPALAVFSVEPELERAELRTEVGWARLHRSSGQRVEALTLREVRPAMRASAERYLGQSESPRLNTAEALAHLLTPPLRAAGLPSPRFRFRLPSGAVLELDGPPSPLPG
ncbi:MAG TPA: DUF4230 domain-containing protein [Rubricoccaceae bacterium]|nr:DUF4230 domain-containing protein [Rubricoccaceae bacterium]